MKSAGRRGKRLSRNMELPFRLNAEERIARGVSAYLGKNSSVKFTDNSSVMISYTKKPGCILELRLHHMFREADETIIRAISRYVKSQDRESSELLNRFIRSNRSLVRRKRGKVGKLEPVGRHFDLEAIYNKINERYFDGTINVAITWGRKTRRKARRHIRLGSYSYENRLIRIHPNLDRKWVPAFFIESIVYHEMLHAYFQVTSKNGRSLYHTPEFREMEEAFPSYELARDWERQNIHRLLH